MEIPLEWYTERGREIPGLTFTSEDMAEWDDDDREAAMLAMEASMHDRILELEAENQRLRDRLVDWRANYMEED